jgi:hypothetical protein
MSADSSSKESLENGNDLWKMPEVLSMKIIQVHHKNPVQYFIKSKLVDVHEEIEFLVNTSEDFPIRALSPALFIGDFSVTEFSRVSKNIYRFVTPSMNVERLKKGSPISIGWLGVKSKKIKTNFQFEIHDEQNR